MNGPAQTPWWARPFILLLVVIIAGMPLWLPAVPPLTDYPGHMGRYFVQLDGGRSADLAQWYHFQWRWLGNLGADGLVQLLGPSLGVEGASKSVAIAVPMLTVAAFLTVSKQVHGQLAPASFFALPLAWSYPFLWGFVNFALSMALAFFAFALWVRLSAAQRGKLRFLAFIPISLVIWTAHIYGWAALCVLIGCFEVSQRGLFRRNGLAALGQTALRCLCLMPPLVLMVLEFGKGGAGGQPFARIWFNFGYKQRWVENILRDRWEVFDKASLLILGLVILAGGAAWTLRRQRPSGAPLILAAVVFGVLFLLVPHSLLGSAYADMRLAPYVLATALLAIGPNMPFASWVAAAGLTFFAARTVGTGLSMAAHDRSYRAELAALAHIPVGSRVLALVGKPCAPDWAVHRLDHLPSIALIRRRAFVNDQWQASGAQLISVRYAAAGSFRADPSQFVTEPRCARRERMAFPKAIATFPRNAFDYVWVLQKPPGDADLSGLEPVWQNGSSMLLRVLRTG